MCDSTDYLLLGVPIGRCAEGYLRPFAIQPFGWRRDTEDDRIVVFAQAELTGREVSLHNQKLALESLAMELQDTKQTIDRFRYEVVSRRE